MFLIFENIYIKNHLNNMNTKLPSNFIYFRNSILEQLKNK